MHVRVTETEECPFKRVSTLADRCMVRPHEKGVMLPFCLGLGTEGCPLSRDNKIVVEFREEWLEE